MQWWLTIFLIGIVFVPITSLIFSNFLDKGYIFAKIIGIASISYVIFILGFLKILPFTQTTIFIVIALFAGINILIFRQKLKSAIKQFNNGTIKIILFEEILFLGVLLLWSFIHGHAPDIHGLEKYMDFGFINSILRTDYFPPKDMWFTPFPINYYYFGHLVTAVLTKLSFLPSNITFNLMLSTISALSFTASFSIGANLLSKLDIKRYILYAGGILTALILNFAGNLHAIYLFFKPYQNENPLPFWQLIFSSQTFPNSYWYPNATRFIHNTIHEFPIYSSVVSDLHGHFLDIPFVLLTIAILVSLFFKSKLEIVNWKLVIPLISFLLAAMYMTNAWDGIIYLILTIFIFGYLILRKMLYSKDLKSQNSKLLNLPISSFISHLSFLILILGVGFVIFSLPFNLNFKPFASGIGLLCAPKFLTDIGSFGPFLFEANHCQRSPIWQLGILYGFFYFWVISFIVFIFRKLNARRYSLNASDIFILILILLSTLLIIIPEFIYVKDIYPAHYRANTMFKLVYEAFIMLSISSGYIITRLISNFKFHPFGKLRTNFKFVYWIIGLLTLTLVFLYPYFAINSYFGNLRNYSGLDGTKYLKSSYPNDYEAILWINKNIKEQPVILEAQGDSYTDYGRVSTNTGLPTVLGWTVHEWLWRGSYDIPSPRITEIQTMYESKNLEETKNLLKKYDVSLIFIGSLEKQKYPNLNEEKFKSLGKIIFQKEESKIFEIN
ncbi:MAG: DUF2298 domain-containing protein [Candidatus Pacearchaeota archaeon]|nr:DUF2298 domain-containing protein [Candidatus Pacearchaeota archaeon]